MSEMIERVARAIHEEHAEPGWSADECATCEKLARAAIGAMREPTEAMRLKAAKMGGISPGVADVAWRAMVEAALHPQE